MSHERRLWWFLVGAVLLVATLYVVLALLRQTRPFDCGFACGAGSSVSDAPGP